MGKWRRVKSLPRRWQRIHLIKKFGGICYLCGDHFKTIKEITFDHWEPLSKGGADSLPNYRLAHLECKTLKADLTPDEFAEFQAGNINWLDPALNVLKTF